MAAVLPSFARTAVPLRILRRTLPSLAKSLEAPAGLPSPSTSSLCRKLVSVSPPTPVTSSLVPTSRTRAMSSVAPAANQDEATAPSWKVELVPCLSDNYAYLVFHAGTKAAAVVDPSEAGPVEAAVQRLGLRLQHVLCTHHHWDHTGGNLDLKGRFGAQVVGPAADRDRIPGIDIALGDGEVWSMGGLDVHAMHTPGHTRGHCSFFLPQLGVVFTGDTLFALGCGRLFEGTPSQMWTSLSRLAALPPATKVYCGHEYTQSNAKFALSVEPGNEELQARARQVNALRQQNQPTIPSTIREEAATNPFLRPQSQEIRDSVRAAPGASDSDVLAAVRRAKDNF